MTAEEEGNVAIMRKAYGLWKNSDQFAHRIELMADNICWNSIGGGAERMEFSRACGGKQDVVRYFEELARDWQLLSYEADEFIAQGDRVVMLAVANGNTKPPARR